MKTLRLGLIITGVIVLSSSVCSKAPVVEFPEPTDRIVLVEFFTEDF
ncbi:hypothetical protein JXB22_02765 [candidate division WOR-3 bacterium]|nr:hypothetical protein [candidate division WOR-3 bacterium]